MDQIIKQNIKQILLQLKDKFDVEQKNILITGGSGFLGSWVCDVLVEKDANVICVDNFTSGLKENISHLLNKDNFKFIEHDITKSLNLNKSLDLILHLASRASPFEFQKFPIQILKANILGTWIVLGMAKKNNCPLLFASSSEIYGNPTAENIPTPEAGNEGTPPELPASSVWPRLDSAGPNNRPLSGSLR